jgi:hypothetical protein
MREKRAIIYRSTLIVWAVRRDHFNAAHWDRCADRSCAFRRPRAAKDDPNWEEFMPRLVGFSRFADMAGYARVTIRPLLTAEEMDKAVEKTPPVRVPQHSVPGTGEASACRR